MVTKQTSRLFFYYFSVLIQFEKEQKPDNLCTQQMKVLIIESHVPKILFVNDLIIILLLRYVKKKSVSIKLKTKSMCLDFYSDFATW